jgi:peptidoglycan/LPS O-acetylase OafA/YrhL
VLAHAVLRPDGRRNSLSIGGPLAFVGFYSYSIYLWHLPVATWLPMIVRRLPVQLTPGTVQLLYVCASVAVGVAMATLIELPLLALRERWFPSRSVPIQPTPVYSVPSGRTSAVSL